MVMEYENYNVPDAPVQPDNPASISDQNSVDDDNYTDTDMESLQQYYENENDRESSIAIDRMIDEREQYDERSDEERMADAQSYFSQPEEQPNADQPILPKPIVPQTTKTVNAKTTSSGSGGAPAEGKAVTTNPLTEFSSATYQITLYILTPEAANELVKNGLKTFGDKKDEVKIIVQSGGVGPTPRPDVFEKADAFKNVEFFIDDLKFKNFTGIQGGPSNVTSTEMEFTVYEPYGISFPTRLRKAHEQIKSISKLPNVQQDRNALVGYYAIGIRFFGYDKDGKLLKGTDIPGRKDWSRLDEYAHFERIFTIKITGLEFKLDGKTTSFRMKAANVPFASGLNVEYGKVSASGEIDASTFKEAISELKKHLNKEQEKFKQDRPEGEKARHKYPIEYDVVYHEMPDENFVNSKLSTDYFKQKKYVSHDAVDEKKVESNNNETKEPHPVQPKVRMFAWPSGTAITQIIENLIKNSEYGQKYAKQKTLTEKDAKTEYQDTEALKWFTIVPVPEATAFEDAKNNYVYKITYHVIKYDVPYVRTNQAKASKYPGPFKRYEYWYTGQNAEIIDFTQTYDKLYVLTAEPDSSKTKDVIHQRTFHTGSQAIAGTPQYMEGMDGITTDLYLTGDNITLNLTITGDPDYIVHCNSSGMSRGLASRVGYDGHSLNPNAGQQFLEIKFNQADDYNVDDGLLNVNDRIRFWSYPAEYNPDVMIYQIISVSSTFSKGKFTQKIEAFLASNVMSGQPPATVNSEQAAADQQVSDSCATMKDPPYELSPEELEQYNREAELDIQNMNLGAVANQPSTEGEYEIDEVELVQYQIQAEFEIANMSADPPVQAVTI